MKSYYDVGWVKASLEKLPDGKYELVEIDCRDNCRYKYKFSSKVKALEEILSYCEILDEDFFTATAGKGGLSIDFSEV